jgi:hypothetical protein
VICIVIALVARLQTPTPPSVGAIKSIRVGNPISVLNNQGDTWVGAWGRDGSLFSPSNDTFGFNRVCNSNIAISRILGDDVLSLGGDTVNTMADYGVSSQLGPDGCNWKSTGCASIDGVVYWALSRHTYGETSGDSHRRQTARNGSLIKSADGGKTWTRSAKENYDHPMFPGSRFSTPYFVDYGKNDFAKVDRADRFVYAISNNGFWDNGDTAILGRVPRKKIGNLDAADWKFYSGGDGGSNEAWVNDSAHAALILNQPNHLGMSGVTYIATYHTYLMIGWYYPMGGGKMPGASRETIWDFYTSPKPWGPWRKLSSHSFSPQGYYCPTVCLKFSSNGGKRLFAVTAGDWNDHSVYRLTLVPLDLE